MERRFLPSVLAVVLAVVIAACSGGGGGEAAVGTDELDGAAIFGQRCAVCHGSGGGGGIGPKLNEGRVVEQYPSIEDQIQLITKGRGGMPGFENQLSPEAIRAVVEYTRTL